MDSLGFLAHLSTECSVSHCDFSPSVSVHLSVHSSLVNTLAFTNINESATKLGQNVYDHKVSNEFDYGTNQTRTELSALE